MQGGNEYRDIQSLTLVRSAESLCFSFSADVLGMEHSPEPLRIWADDEVVLDGRIDVFNESFSAIHESISGRDGSATIVDSSAAPAEWTMRKASLLDVVRAVASPLGVTVQYDSSLELLPPAAKTVINPGETAFSVILKAAQAAGVIVVSNGLGGILITRSGEVNSRAAVVEGQNVVDASRSINSATRFRRYTVLSSQPRKRGAVRETVTDEGVVDLGRTLLILPETSLDSAHAIQRADWEARIRAARGDVVTATVVGWKVAGEIWPINTIVPVRLPSFGIDEQRIVSSAVHTMSEDGEFTELTLLRPDVFTPGGAIL